ncbi:MAG: 2-amino-4-hydroxy-6-hydroxymethyldihydropteridine diphosphokinase [Proteobacteria bacterium]|nr:2-amino-4-hydroxy-6-hydroxymethyldihydropteridine diphosphokinase [Pseudomonadota bacterium]
MSDPIRAYIGIGANLGDLAATIRRACDQLAALPETRFVRRSSLYATAPQQATGPDYLNAVVALDTQLGAAELLALLHRIEAEHGRERPYRNAPRTLDLDLLLHGDARIETAALRVPHPRAHLRAFVLLPLLELDPAIVIPGLGAAAAWLPGVADQRIDKLSA